MLHVKTPEEVLVLIDTEFAAWIFSFNRNHRKGYYELLARQENKTVLIFRNRNQVRKFLNQL